MRCSMGTSQAKLTVLPSRTVFLTGQPMANISDHLPMVNLTPFGRCRSLGFPATAKATAANHGHLTPMPCMHYTPLPWRGGKNDYIVEGDPALLKSSTCQCMYGGTISIVDDGQKNTGPADLNYAAVEDFENEYDTAQTPKQSKFLDVTKRTTADSPKSENMYSFEIDSNAKNNLFSMGGNSSPKIGQPAGKPLSQSNPKDYSTDERTYPDADPNPHQLDIIG